MAIDRRLKTITSLEWAFEDTVSRWRSALTEIDYRPPEGPPPGLIRESIIRIGLGPEEWWRQVLAIALTAHSFTLPGIDLRQWSIGRRDPIGSEISRLSQSSDLPNVEPPPEYGVGNDELIDHLVHGVPRMVSREVRKLGGEEVTPSDIVDLMLDLVEKKSHSAAFDPACGTGAFLLGLLRRRPRPERIEGFDTNPLFVHLANVTTKLFDPQLTHPIASLSDSLQHFVDSEGIFGHPSPDRFDLVVGNPPYLRIHRLGERKGMMRRWFGSATGRFDSYVLFIEMGIRLLKGGGEFAFITSNKFLTALYGTGLRRFLADRATLKYLIDFGDVRLFPNSAVLPIILVGSSGRSSEPMIAVSARLLGDRAVPPKPLTDAIRERLRARLTPAPKTIARAGDADVHIECIVQEQPSGFSTWSVISKRDAEIRKQVDSHLGRRLKDVARVFVGVKTTADDVFVNELTPERITDLRLEPELVHRLVQAKDVKRYYIDWRDRRGSWILYPHQEVGRRVRPIDLNAFPNARAYLEGHKTRLQSRGYVGEAGRQWFEIWVPQHPHLFKAPKIVVRDIAPVNTFALDRDGYFLQGNTFGIVLRDDSPDYLVLICAYLNSTLAEFLMKFGGSTSLYAGRIRYTATFLNDLAVPPGELVDETLLALARRVVSSRGKTGSDEFDRRLYELTGLDEDMIAHIEQMVNQLREVAFRRSRGIRS